MSEVRLAERLRLELSIVRMPVSGGGEQREYVIKGL